MKILILANNDVGLYKFRKEFIKRLLLDHKVTISLPYGDMIAPLEIMGCKFINTPLSRRGINPFKDFKLLKMYKKICKQVRPDLIITYTIKPNIYGCLMAKWLHIEYAANITGLGTAFQKDNYLKKIIIDLYKLAMKNAKAVFFENIENQQVFLYHRIIAKYQGCLLNGAGVNLDEYPYTPYPDKCDIIKFLFIGRIMKEKGIDELLHAAEQIKYLYPNTQFDVIGPMEDDYKEIIEHHVLRKVIIYHGFQNDVIPFVKQCHCLVLPSYHEGMANTLLEAGAIGRVLITSNIHGCKEAVEIGKNGYLCKPGDNHSLIKAMINFIKDQNKKEMGFNSRKLMEAKFDKNKIIDIIMNTLF